MLLLAVAAAARLTLGAAARAAPFAWAAYDTPPATLARDRIGEADVMRFAAGLADHPKPIEPLRCSGMLAAGAAESEFELASLRRHCFIDVPTTGTQAEAWVSDDGGSRAVLAFRGTDIDAWQDIVTDIYFAQSLVELIPLIQQGRQ